MKKKIITICDECGKNILDINELVVIDKYGLKKFTIGGMYTRVVKDFCSNECAIKHLKKEKWQK